MTVTYTGRVANAGLGAFSRLLLYWRGSIYKLMYKEMLLFCGLYALISVVYRLALNEDQKRVFEKIALHCEAFTNLIPLSFVLGFYVAIVVTRWWNQFVNIPWPDRIMMFVGAMLEGADEHGRLMRRTLMRYMTLASLLVFQLTSVSVKKRFPTMEHLLEAGVIHHGEVKAMDDINTPHGKWWVPVVWATNLLRQAYKEGRIKDEISFKTLLEEVQRYRGNLGMLICYDWISVPLVYTQVTTLACYTFFLGSLFGRQFLDPEQGYPGHSVDLYVPTFTILQFFFYMGWLKVAEQLINPFGEDDDDFDMNSVVDRNLQVSLITVDDMYEQVPMLERDAFFGEEAPDCLPYTISSIGSIRQPFQGSTADISLSTEGMKLVNPLETIPETDQLHTTHVSSPYLTSTSRLATPIISPAHSRHRLGQNMIGGLHNAFSISRCTLDSIKTRHPDVPISMLQTLEGTRLTNASSCLENLVNSSKLHVDAQHMISNPITQHQPSPTYETPSQVIEVSPPPIYKQSEMEQAHKRFIVQNVELKDDTFHVRSASVGSKPKASDVAGSNVIEPERTAASEKEKMSTEIRDVEKCTEYSSSAESLSLYNAPPSNQSTVNSLTPLLKQSSICSIDMEP